MGRLNEKDAINIMLVILKVANERTDIDGAKKTTKAATIMVTPSKVLYNVLFNEPKLKLYWDVLIQKGLLSYDPNTGRFNTTTEGRIFLRAYNDMDYDVIKARRTKPTSKRQKQQKIDLSNKLA